MVKLFLLKFIIIGIAILDVSNVEAISRIHHIAKLSAAHTFDSCTLGHTE